MVYLGAVPRAVLYTGNSAVGAVPKQEDSCLEKHSWNRFACLVRKQTFCLVRAAGLSCWVARSCETEVFCNITSVVVRRRRLWGMAPPPAHLQQPVVALLGSCSSTVNQTRRLTRVRSRCCWDCEEGEFPLGFLHRFSVHGIAPDRVKRCWTIRGLTGGKQNSLWW